MGGRGEVGMALYVSKHKIMAMALPLQHSEPRELL